MGKKLLLILFILFHSIIVLLFSDIYELATFYFYSLLIFIFFDFYLNKKISLITTWCLSFVFIILSEVFLLINTGIDNNSLRALKFLIIANNLVIIGYNIMHFKNDKHFIKTYSIHKPKKSSYLIIYLTLIIYLAYQIPFALFAYINGRNVFFEIDQGLLGSVMKSISLIFPAIICYYYVYVKKKNIYIPLLLSTPIFVILFMFGSRYPLLFSAGSFFIVFQGYKNEALTFKKLIPLITGVLLLLSLSSAIKGNRILDSSKDNFVYKDIPTTISQYMSQEGVITRTNLLMNHFENNDFLLGKSTSFILYFWVPRPLWPDKPTMLGHWLIRQYEDVSVFHSVSFGFTGDIYADFGYFSLIIVVFFGVFLKKLEVVKDINFRKGGYNLVIGAMFFPFVFFFVRSPITSSMTFLVILAMYKIYGLLIFKKS